MSTYTTADYIEAAYAQALELVAIGESRMHSEDTIRANFPMLWKHEVERVLREALRDARRQGVEREDIDETWFGTWRD